MLPRRYRRPAERVIESALFLCAAGSVLVTAGIIAVLLVVAIVFALVAAVSGIINGRKQLAAWRRLVERPGAWRDPID